jgi:tRNA (mo5U34)-methyltransferase
LRLFGRQRRSLRARNRPSLRPELLEELGREPRWTYEWQLGPGSSPPLLGEELPSVHRTRLELIEGPVRAALSAAGPDATALDLACNEGWFSQRLLEWGARSVVGIDIRDVNIRRAELLREHYGISPERLSFRVGDVYGLDADELGRFDVVLLLGLVYHVEDPAGLVRRARAFTKGLCVIESQLTRQNEPISHGWGQSGELESAEGSFAARLEPGQETNPLASYGGVLSLIPNRAALELLAKVAGFRTVRFVPPSPHHNEQYVLGDRAVMIATV